MADNELPKLTISELSLKIRAREVSPTEVVESALAQAERLQPALNSFITILYDQARSKAKEQEEALVRGEYKGPLHGIPIGIKDSIATAGIPTTAASKVFSKYIPETDAHVVKLCKDAGAIILGKENLDEFSGGATSNSPHFGPVNNPWALDHIPGGSTGGGGANVAACVTYASLGADGGGSVRLPGAFCGVVGLKQTFGRVSLRGALLTSYNTDHLSPLTRSVADSALMLQVIAGYDPLDPGTVRVPVPDYSDDLGKTLHGLKMGIPNNHHFDILDPEVEAAVRQAILALEELGVEPKEVSFPSLAYAGALHIPYMSDNVVNHEPHLKAHRDDYGHDVLVRALANQFVMGTDYAKSLKLHRIIKEEHLRVLQQVDFLVTPTSPVVAPQRGDNAVVLGKGMGKVRGPGSGILSRNLRSINATGLPAITVPCGFNRAGLPIGLQLVGRSFEEGLLFRVGHAYEAVSPSRGRRPPIVDGV